MLKRSRHRTTGGSLDLPAAGYPNARLISTPTARQMAEVDLHARTLRMILRTTDQLQALAQGDGDTVENEALLVALWTSGLIQYARCFDKSYGKGLAADKVFAFSPELLEYHVELMDVRSKHIAHDVNAMRRTDVAIQISAEGKIGDIVRPFVFRMPSPAEAALLGIVARAAETFAVIERDRLKRELVLYLEGLAPEQLLALPPLTYERLADAPVKGSRR